MQLGNDAEALEPAGKDKDIGHQLKTIDRNTLRDNIPAYFASQKDKV